MLCLCSFRHFFQCFCSQIARACTLWLFCDKTELFTWELCVGGQNIVLRVTFSSTDLATSVNRGELSKPDPEQTNAYAFQLLEIELKSLAMTFQKDVLTSLCAYKYWQVCICITQHIHSPPSKQIKACAAADLD